MGNWSLALMVIGFNGQWLHRSLASLVNGFIEKCGME